MYNAMKPGLEALEGKPLQHLITNWKTTLAGLIVVFCAAGSYLGFLTMEQTTAIASVATAFGLVLSKDVNK